MRMTTGNIAMEKVSHKLDMTSDFDDRLHNDCSDEEDGCCLGGSDCTTRP